jgi:hypothetical protein
MNSHESSKPAELKWQDQFLVRLLIAFGCVQFGNFALLATFRDGMGFIVFLPAWAVGLGIWGAAAFKSMEDRRKLLICVLTAVAVLVTILASCNRAADLSDRLERESLAQSASH